MGVPDWALWGLCPHGIILPQWVSFWDSGPGFSLSFLTNGHSRWQAASGLRT